MTSSGAHIHLMINHVPVLAAPFALMFFVLALLRKSDSWLWGGMLLLAIALAGDVASYLSGGPAISDIAELPRTSNAALEAHHARATYALVSGAAALLAALVVWAARRRRVGAPWTTLFLVMATLVHALALTWTALPGGAINHPELQDADDQRGGAVHAHHHNTE